MKLPDAIAPYASLLKWALIAVMCAALFIGGCQRGKRVQAEAGARELAQAHGHRDALQRSLRAHARTFRAIAATTAANVRAAQARAKRAVADETFASQSRAGLERRIAELAHAAELERITCSEAETRICGTPLR